MTLPSKIIIALLFMALFTDSINTFASEPDSVHAKIPTLNGHGFFPLGRAGGPFISSFLKISVGAAQTEPIDFGVLEINGREIYNFDGTVLYSDIDIEFQQKIKDWLGIYFRYRSAARFGAQISSIYSEGLNTVSGYELGWIIKVSEGKKHFLSTHLQLSDYKTNYIYLDRFILNVIRDTVISSSENIPALFGAAGIHLALAPNDLIGFCFNGSVGYGESFNRDNSRIFARFGVSTDIDLYKRTPIPLGIGLQSSISSFPSYDQLEDKYTNLTGVKLAYTGSNEYIIGIETAWGILPIKTRGTKVNAILINLQFHLYF